MDEFINIYKNQNLDQKFKIFGYINIQDESENKHVYYFYIEPTKNNMIVFRTLNKRNEDFKILSLIQKKISQLKINIMFYEDIPRHFMMNACPEIIMAIAINKLAEDI
jgi:hypothetical protein